MWMDEQHIVKAYVSAKNHDRQIDILAQLNGCAREDIIAVLLAHGVAYKRKRKASKKKRVVWRKSELIKLLRLHDEGLGYEEIAQKMGKAYTAQVCHSAWSKMQPHTCEPPTQAMREAWAEYTKTKE